MTLSQERDGLILQCSWIYTGLHLAAYHQLLSCIDNVIVICLFIMSMTAKRWTVWYCYSSSVCSSHSSIVLNGLTYHCILLPPNNSITLFSHTHLAKVIRHFGCRLYFNTGGYNSHILLNTVYCFTHQWSNSLEIFPMQRECLFKENFIFKSPAVWTWSVVW